MSSLLFLTFLATGADPERTECGGGRHKARRGERLGQRLGQIYLQLDSFGSLSANIHL